MFIGKKRYLHAIKTACILTLTGCVLSSAFAVNDAIEINLLAGGSIMGFDHNGHVVFPPGSFRVDSFENNGHAVNFAPAIGIAYDLIIAPNPYNHGYLFHDISLGLNLYYNQTSRSASVYEYSLPDFHNSNYTMDVESGRLMVDTEWNIHPLWQGIMPFVEGGLGVARNTLGFKNTPLPNIGVDGGNYHLSDRTQIQFAYEAGAGLKLPVNRHLQLSARYLYANAGNARSSTHDNNTGVVLNNAIKTSVNSQSVLFGLSYLFG